MVSAAAAASVATAHYLQFRIQWASIALLYYDYALTFPAEVKYMWGRKFRFSTVLYICCRYALIANVLFLAAIAHKIPNVHKYVFKRRHARKLSESYFFSCDTWYKFDGTISVLGRASVIAALTGRTYAVYGCNRLVLVVLGSLGLVCVILDIMHVPGLNCIGGTTNAIVVDFTEAGLLAILMCVFEFLAVALTVVRCLQECRVGGTWKFERGNFFTLITQQGIYYYCIISIFTTAAVVLTFRAPLGSFFQRIPNAFNLPVSCLLTARFLLQLREWQERDTISAGTSSGDGALHFGGGGGGGGVGDSHAQAQTLSALRAFSVVNSTMLDDFGDGEFCSSGAHSSWETESTRAYAAEPESGGSTDGPTELVTVEELAISGKGKRTSEKKEGVVVDEKV